MGIMQQLVEHRDLQVWVRAAILYRVQLLRANDNASFIHVGIQTGK